MHERVNESQTVVGALVVAAGAGRRMGGPKALVRDSDGESWLVRAIETMKAAGCDPIVVVIGAGAADVLRLLDRESRAHPAVSEATVTVADDWHEGMAASLRAGIRAFGQTTAEALVVTLVDLPGLVPAAVRRVVRSGMGDSALVQATYEGRPGHPVLIGRAHWARLLDTLSGDSGARTYLAAHSVTPVECGDLWSGDDVDSRPQGEETGMIDLSVGSDVGVVRGEGDLGQGNLGQGDAGSSSSLR